jgi:hypothetical protein
VLCDGGRFERAEEGRGQIERLVEDGPERVTEARIRHELRVREPADGSAEEVDPGERVRLAGQEEDGTRDRRPVGDARLAVGRTGAVERVAEEDEAGVACPGFGSGEARDPTAERVAPDGDVRAVRDLPMERRERRLGPAPGELEGRRSEAASLQPPNERGHTGGVPARAVAKVDVDRHRAEA